MKRMHKAILRLIRPILEHELRRIAKEKEHLLTSPRHVDEDCGFQLLEEIKN